MRGSSSARGTRPPGVSGEQETSAFVREMFSRIAPRYDLLNHLLSFNLDRRWRRRTAQAVAARLAAKDSLALDLCCGTGDLTLELAQAGGGTMVGSDFSHAMLLRAREKSAGADRVRLIGADALALPFPDGAFDVITSAFGFRNLANYRRGLEETRRVLKPGGEAAILEFALPRRGVFAGFYRFYFQRVVPWVGRIVSGVSGPYSYLPASVVDFPDCEEFADWMKAAGFTDVRYETWTGGTVALHRGRKPGA